MNTSKTERVLGSASPPPLTPPEIAYSPSPSCVKFEDSVKPAPATPSTPRRRRKSTTLLKTTSVPGWILVLRVFQLTLAIVLVGLLAHTLDIHDQDVSRVYFEQFRSFIHTPISLPLFSGGLSVLLFPYIYPIQRLVRKFYKPSIALLVEASLLLLWTASTATLGTITVLIKPTDNSSQTSLGRGSVEVWNLKWSSLARTFKSGKRTGEEVHIVLRDERAWKACVGCTVLSALELSLFISTLAVYALNIRRAILHDEVGGRRRRSKGHYQSDSETCRLRPGEQRPARSEVLFDSDPFSDDREKILSTHWSIGNHDWFNTGVRGMLRKRSVA